jgi:hypothetical protein
LDRVDAPQQRRANRPKKGVTMGQDRRQRRRRIAALGGAVVAAKKHRDAQQQEAAAAAPPATAVQPGAAGGLTPEAVEQLKQLGELHEQNVLSDEEFASEKAKLLRPA